MYERERNVFGPWIEFATRAELTAAALGTAGVELLRSAAAIQKASKAMHDAQRAADARAPTHPHELLCVGPATMAKRVISLVADLEEIAKRLRAKSLVTEFQRKPSATRPARELLTCVWQHLHIDGGLKYAEGLAPRPRSTRWHPPRARRSRQEARKAPRRPLAKPVAKEREAV
jgi:hypothetical protein